MKMRLLIALAPVLFVFSAVEIRAQESNTNQLVRPRVVAQNPGAPPTVSPAVNQKLPVNPSVPLPDSAPAATTAAEAQKTTETAPLTFFTPSVIQSRISEARRMLKTRPMTTASVPSIEFVTIAALDRENAKTHLITLSKQSFLTKGAQVNAVSSLGDRKS